MGTAGWCAGRTHLLLSFRPCKHSSTAARHSPKRILLSSTFTFSLRPSYLSPTLPQPLSNCIAGSIHQKIFLPLEPGCSYIPYSTIITIILGRDTQCTREATPTDSEQHTIDSLYRLQAQHHHFILSNTRIAHRRIHFPKIHSFFQQSLNAGPFEKARNPEVLRLLRVNISVHKGTSPPAITWTFEVGHQSLRIARNSSHEKHGFTCRKPLTTTQSKTTEICTCPDYPL